jgi:hypothetical protein
VFSSVLDILKNWDKLIVPKEWEQAIKNGKKPPIDLNLVQNDDFFLLDKKNKILAWAKKVDQQNFIYKKVFTTD